MICCLCLSNNDNFDYSYLDGEDNEIEKIGPKLKLFYSI